MKALNYLLIIIGIAGLVSVRVLEDRLFYDPILAYFKSESAINAFPKFDGFKIIISHLFRFVLNLLFSLLIIQNIFRNKEWTLQAALLMVVVFVIVFPIYLYCLYTQFDIGLLFSFYMRRFVIQPMTLLLIVPIFYYRKHILT